MPKVKLIGVDGTGAEVDVETILDMLRDVLSDDRVREIKVDLTNGVRELPPQDGFRRYGPDGTTVIRIEIVRVPRSAAPRREQYRPGVYEYFGGAGCPPVVYFDGKEWTRPGWEVPMTLGEDRDDSLTIDPEKIGELLWEERR